MAQIVAAIDCGTNSIRLLITDGARDLAREMRIVRLGQGVDRTGRLDPAAIERTRVALAEYTQLIGQSGVDRVRMVATSASRDASNADDFREMVRSTLGQDPEVISGNEEAALSFAGALGGLDAAREHLVVDIGGGSTEFVRGTGKPEAAISVDIGCVRMTERHLHTDPPAPAELSAAQADITAAVASALSHVGGAPTLVGLAGTVTTLGAMALELPFYDPARIHHSVLGAASVERITVQLAGMSREERAAVPVMHPGRVDVIVAGAVILREILRQTGLPSVIVSEHDILDGIALSVLDGY